MKANDAPRHFDFIIERIFIKITRGHIEICTGEADRDMSQCAPCIYIYNVNGANIYVCLNALPHGS